MWQYECTLSGTLSLQVYIPYKLIYVSNVMSHTLDVCSKILDLDRLQAPSTLATEPTKSKHKQA